MSIKSALWDKIRRSISQGQLDKATEALKQAARRHPDLYDVVVVIDGRRQEFQRQRAAGLLDPREEARQHARLSADLLDVTQQLQQRANAPRPWPLRWLAATLLVLLCGGGYWYWQQPDAELKAYRQTLDANTVPACAHYLEQYPTGKYQLEIQQKVLDLNRQLDRYLQSARVMQQSGEPEKALEFAQKALEIHPDHPEARQLVNQFSK